MPPPSQRGIFARMHSLSPAFPRFLHDHPSLVSQLPTPGHAPGIEGSIFSTLSSSEPAVSHGTDAWVPVPSDVAHFCQSEQCIRELQRKLVHTQAFVRRLAPAGDPGEGIPVGTTVVFRDPMPYPTFPGTAQEENVARLLDDMDLAFHENGVALDAHKKAHLRHRMRGDAAWFRDLTDGSYDEVAARLRVHFPYDPYCFARFQGLVANPLVLGPDRNGVAWERSARRSARFLTQLPPSALVLLAARFRLGPQPVGDNVARPTYDQLCGMNTAEEIYRGRGCIHDRFASRALFELSHE